MMVVQDDSEYQASTFQLPTCCDLDSLKFIGIVSPAEYNPKQGVERWSVNGFVAVRLSRRIDALPDLYNQLLGDKFSCIARS